MLFRRGRGPSWFAALLVGLLTLPAAAQSEILVRPVQVPGAGLRALVVRLDVAGGGAQSSMPTGQGGSSGLTVGANSLLPTPEAPQQFRSAWVDVFGLQHQLVTEQESGETADGHALRHAAGVAVLLAEFPAAAPEAGVPAAPLETGAQALETSWKGMTGLDHQVTTVRKTGESLDKWAERHADGVAALLKVFPPKPVGLACGPRRALRVA
jgi:hypothetical protein